MSSHRILGYFLLKLLSHYVGPSYPLDQLCLKEESCLVTAVPVALVMASPTAVIDKYLLNEQESLFSQVL